jgi:hypothetical protein
MFNVTLYQFNKKHNSTAVPASDGVVLSCEMKSETSTIAPVIMLKTNPNAYNYAYIPEFNRYYFIDNISYAFGVWNVSLICDVLATYKTDIGAASLLVERSASASDGSIIDALRLTKATHTSIKTQLEEFNTGSGVYVVTILSGTGSGSIAYQMSGSDFKTFLNTMIPALESWDPGDLAQGVINAIANPLQYITGCHWFPTSFLSAGAVGSIMVGPVVVGGLAGTSLVDLSGASQTSATYAIDKHPQAAAVGQFANLAPFSRYAVDFPPFGLIELDPTKLIGHSSIDITLLRDAYTGEGRITITAGNNILAEVAGQYGVPIPVSQSNVEMGAIVGAVEGIAEIAAGKTLRGALTLLSAAGSALPTVRTLGSRGSIAGIRAAKYLYEMFSTITPIDSTNQGLPLQAVRTISTLSGYIQTATGDITATGATLQELEAIRNYLTGGFYYE